VLHGVRWLPSDGARQAAHAQYKHKGWAGIRLIGDKAMNTLSKVDTVNGATKT
jgi:hypothetical protein